MPEGLDLSGREVAKLYVTYVNTHRELLYAPAEHSALMAIRNHFPCSG